MSQTNLCRVLRLCIGVLAIGCFASGAQAFDDCNGNEIPDVCDIDLGTCDVQNYCSDWPREERCLSEDLNGNHVPDECEDCNGNDIPDECDVNTDTCRNNGNCSGIEGSCQLQDCNDNNVPDECSGDCNDNGVWDECEEWDGTRADCDGNDVLDECEDCNGNGIPDHCDIEWTDQCGPCGVGYLEADQPERCFEPSRDCNHNGVPDECEDCNGNEIPDYCDINCEEMICDDCFWRPPANDDCPEAQPLQIPSTTWGNLALAQTDGYRYCVSGGCGDYGSADGVWYSVQGTGKRITASICNQGWMPCMDVYCGDCDHLICPSLEYTPCNTALPNPRGGYFSWCSQPDQVYLIFVFHCDGYPVDSTFTLELTQSEEDCMEPTLDCTVPANDDCEEPTPLGVDESVFGFLQNAHPDDLPDCAVGNSMNPGLWYSVTGTGEFLTASLCGGGAALNNAPQLEVFCGDCDLLSCADPVYEPCSVTGTPYRQEAHWCSADGTPYLIRVSGDYQYGFDLSISASSTCDEPPDCERLPNDDCEGATPLTLGSAPVEVDLNQASYDGYVPCGECPYGAVGVWYTVQGTGKEMVLGFCQSEYQPNVEI